MGKRPTAAELVRPGPKFRPQQLTSSEAAQPHFATNSYSPATLVVLAVVAAHCWLFCSSSDYALPLVTGYLHTDAFLAAFHMWLDDPVALTSPIVPIAKLAWEFQHHHDYPGDVFHKNHVSTIDLGVSGTSVILLAAFWLGGLESWALTHCLSIGFWGYVGAANHVAMHCRTHKHSIPYMFEAGQDLGILMHPKHHKAHHTAPFDCYFSFLTGFNVVFTKLYNGYLKHNRPVLTAILVMLLPPFFILAIGGAAVLDHLPFALPLKAVLSTAGLAVATRAFMREGPHHDWDRLKPQKKA